jgi:glycosyltransferase involved in cell wall biosynthesis
MLNTLIKQEPLISIIIPTYNRPDYLKQAITSAVNQTYRNIEIIVSDNCSHKNPQSIVESFQDSRIKFLRNTKNLGMCANMVNPVKIAKGKYIAFLLDDDIWKDNFLENLVPPLESNANLAAAFCDHYFINSQGEINLAATEESATQSQRHILKEGIHQPFYEIGLVRKSLSSTIGAVIRKDLVEWDKIPLEVGGYIDIYINYLCSRNGRGIYYCSERLALYREHEGTDTKADNPHARITKAKYQIFAYKRFLQDPELQAFYPHFQTRCLQAGHVLGVSLLQISQHKQARSHLWQVVKQKKRSLRTITALSLSWMPTSIANPLLANDWWS